MLRFVAGAMGAAALLSPGLARAELLTNGNVDDPPDHESDLATGWTLHEPTVDSMGMPVNSATFATFANHTPAGERGLWFRPFAGVVIGESDLAVDAILYQDVPGTPGRQYTLSAWFRMEDHYAGLDPALPTRTVLALEFLDVGSGVIDSVMLDIDTVYPDDNQWYQYSVMGFAPVGTVTVRSSASMFDGVLSPMNPQSAFVDDFLLIPTPGSAAALGLGVCAARRRRRA
jgi:hypothetical protein